MKALLIPILLAFLAQVYSQCSYFDSYTPDPETITSCTSGAYAGTASLPRLSTLGSRQLTMTFSVKLTDFCGNSAPLTFLLLKAYTGSAYKPVYGIRAHSRTNYSSYLMDPAGTIILLSQITTDDTNGWLVGAVSFDLANNKVTQSWMSPINYVSNSTTSVNFGTWTFKANNNPYLMNFAINTIIMKYSKASSQKIAFSYGYEPKLFPFLFGALAPTRIGSYGMLENTGYRLTDSGSLGMAYFGESTSTAYDATYSPSWSALGVLFTNRSQYVKMPSTLMFKNTNAIGTVSVSLSFMIRLDEIYVGTIFNRVSATETVMALRINAYGQLQPVISDTVLTTSQTPLPLGQWVQVTVFYMYSYQRATASISFDNTLVTPNLDTIPLKAVSSFTEALTNTFKIGGFKGCMKNLAVYGPGSPRILTSTCPTCALDMGATTAACIRPACTSLQYVMAQSCQSCSTTCLTCGGPGVNGCLTCQSPKVLSETNACVDPPTTTTPPVTTPTTNTTNTTTTISNTEDVVIKTGTGFDADAIVCLIVGILAIGVAVGIVMKIRKRRALNKVMHQEVPTSPEPGHASANIKEDSFY